MAAWWGPIRREMISAVTGWTSASRSTFAIDRLLEGAPGSTLACSAMTNDLNLSGWRYRGRVEGHRDGEVIDLGRHKLRFLETPHVHHWDSMMLFDETTRSLFPSDSSARRAISPPS